MIEVWKPIANFESRYQISNTGKVKSFLHKCPKLLTPKINNKGYAWVELRGDGRKRCFLVHRLVASAFIENPSRLPIINHKDENPLNNNVENLEWCDNSYNARYSQKLHPGRNTGPRPKKSSPKFYKTILIQKTLDGKIVGEYSNISMCANETKYNSWSIAQCCRGKRKTAYGYQWSLKEPSDIEVEKSQ